MTFNSCGSNDVHNDKVLPRHLFTKALFPIVSSAFCPRRVALGLFQLHITPDDLREERE